MAETQLTTFDAITLARRVLARSSEPGAHEAYCKLAELHATLARGGEPIATAYEHGMLDGIGRRPWDDMCDFAAVCGVDYARTGERHPAPEPRRTLLGGLLADIRREYR